MPRKALELTIQAFGRVDRSLPITLTIVGGAGEFKDEVPDYLERYAVAERVRWVGQIPYEQVRQHYREADVFIFTSLRDSCPMQILEAMAFSLPVLTLDLHGQAELVTEETGIKVAVGGVEETIVRLARGIEWFCSHPEARLRMGDAAYARAELNAWPLKIKSFADHWYPAAIASSVDAPIV